MAVVCEKCGDCGWPETLVHCNKCGGPAEHRYCLDILPQPLDREDAFFTCETCEPEKSGQDNLSTPLSRKRRVRESRKEIKKKKKKAKACLAAETETDSKIHGTSPSPTPEVSKRKSNFTENVQLVVDFSSLSDNKNIPSGTNKNNDDPESQRCDSGMSINFSLAESTHSLGDSRNENHNEVPELMGNKRSCIENHEKDQKLVGKKRSHNEKNLEVQKLVGQKKLSGEDDDNLDDVVESVENHEKDQKLVGKKRFRNEKYPEVQKLVGQKKLRGEDDGNLDDVVESVDTKASEMGAIVDDPSNVPERDLDVSMAQPVVDPVWRGNMRLRDKLGIDGLTAHLSDKACFNLKVVEEASILPTMLSPEILPRSEVWPKSFVNSHPKDDNIALYFFPENERDEKAFDILVEKMMAEDLALRVTVTNAELLVFHSHQLPMKSWRFRLKFYLWGVFRAKQSSSTAIVDRSLLNQSNSHKCIVPLISSNNVSTEEENDLVKTKSWTTRSPLSPLSNSGSSEA